MQDRLRREIAAGVAKATRDAMLHGIGFTHGGRHVELKDMLRNVSRTATRRLDEAGVPDNLQGDTGDWDMNDDERDFNG
jgi:hypothetical protein